MARDAIDIKESLGALVMRSRAVQRLHQSHELAAKDDPGNRAVRGDLNLEVQRALAAADAEDTNTD